MKLSPEAEAEIERLYAENKYEVLRDWDVMYASASWQDTLRAAMVWAYQDAARIAESHEDTGSSFTIEAQIANAIDARVRVKP